MTKNISANKFLRFIFEKILFIKQTQKNEEFIACHWSFNSLSLLLIMSEEKIKRKNFTCSKKITRIKLFLKKNPL